jgi:hypothetical protein
MAVTDDMVERVARAIEDVPLPFVRYDTGTGMWLVFRAGTGETICEKTSEWLADEAAEEWRVTERGRAALTALDPPTQAMVEAAIAWTDKTYDTGHMASKRRDAGLKKQINALWSAMLAAAREGK